MNSDFSIGYDGFATGGSLSDMGSFDTSSNTHSNTQSYTGGHVIVGGGHFQSNESPSTYSSNYNSTYTDNSHSHNQSGGRQISIYEAVYGVVPVGGGHTTSIPPARVSLAYNRMVDEISTHTQTMLNNLSGRQITRVGSDSESDAWDKYIDRGKLDNFTEAVKEWGLAFGSQAAGDTQSALEHGLNATIATGKVVWDSLTFKDGLNSLKESDKGTIPLAADK